MPKTDTNTAQYLANPEMDLAWELIANTNVSVFLTGKAGTGKTTFLHRLREKSSKRMVVLAPTGVAAINAQGQTIHSFFQLPFGPLIPELRREQNKRFKMRKDKKELIRTLDLLVIDEISMVRCDLLDAIDVEMRKYRDRYKPFGGVQLLLIGDLQQLAPVTKETERNLLKDYYSTPYFFGSNALRNVRYVTVELQHIYRQQDKEFIDILAQIRDNNISDTALEKLNSRCINFNPDKEENWIRLTTHNHMADNYNASRLNKLPGTEKKFAAKIKGNFPITSYPADEILKLKVGAQVMFIKNDVSGKQSYYNGKIGIIESIDESSILVWTKEDGRRITVEQVTWENFKYILDNKTKEIKEEIDGLFTQFPLRLAWAITIHKSQGLTFDHAVLDINESFAHGQAYVALSRCRTLQGMILTHPLNTYAVITDNSVRNFVNSTIAGPKAVKEQLPKLSHEYYCEILDELYSFISLKHDMQYVHRIINEYLYKQEPDLLEFAAYLVKQIEEKLERVSQQFAGQYRPMVFGCENPDENKILQTRLQSSFKYFYDICYNTIEGILGLKPLNITNNRVSQQLTNAFEALELSYKMKAYCFKSLQKTGFTIENYLQAKRKSSLYKLPVNKLQLLNERKKTEKNNSYRPWDEEQEEELLMLHHEGYNTKEIAAKLERTPVAIRSRLKRLLS